MASIKLITLDEVMKKNLELKISDIQILRKWCEKQPHLPKIQDVQLAIFLHSNYYQIEPTKSTIENYFTLRTHVPEFFSNRDIFKVERMRKMFDVVAAGTLKRRTTEGYHIVMGKLINLMPLHFDFNDVIKYGTMLSDEFIWTYGPSPGLVIVNDATGVSLGHVAHINLMSAKKLTQYFQDAFPVRIKGIHVINTSPIIEIIFNMVKPFINMEFLQLIHFHSSMESANKYFPTDALPNECGGKGGPIQDLVDTHRKKVENFHEWYLEDEKMNRVNESLRIGKSNIINDLFGMEGSFRKIEVD